jgi:hypothetical protein
LTPVLFFVPLFAIIVPVLFRLLRPCQASELTLEWYESFDVSTYSPMQGLLASDDFQFLCQQPGFDPSLFRKLRRDRLRIFRQYLNRLIVDFNRMQKLASLVLSQSPEDQSALFAKLISLRIHFGVAIFRVEVSYLVCLLRTHPVQVTYALQQLEAMSFELAALPLSKSLLARS